MVKLQITRGSEHTTLEAQPGTNLLVLLRSAGLAPEAPCGGNGKCGKCAALVNGVEVLTCNYSVESDITVTLKEKKKTNILTTGAAAKVTADPLKEGHLIAFDIGTTTVVCFLLSAEGEELAVESMLNPQAPFGADVISRIQQALAGETESQTAVIRRGMEQLIAACCAKAGITPGDIGVVSVVGNPCMQQLFLGITPGNLATVPFDPVLTKAEVCSAADYLPSCVNALLLTVPDISGYVGGDTMACVLASRMYEAEDTVLMVDIGTNGEMVLSHAGRMTACSTAAGPALEGANIRFGMRGSPGAIDHVWTENGELTCSVIGGGKAAGICGSGIIDAAAAALNEKLLNKRGRIQSTEEAEGQRILKLTDGVYLTQDDIRQVQMAKGAIAAGIHLMCGYLGITAADIDRVILAGAFGSFLKPESACRIELLPRELLGKIQAAGNLAGAGSRMMAANRQEFALTQKLLDRIEFIELANLPTFQKTFAKCMNFSEN